MRCWPCCSAGPWPGSAGFNGIVAAPFGQLHPLGTISASLLFGAMLVGANKMQRAVQVPSALITALNGLVVVFVVGSEIWRRRLARRQEVIGPGGGPNLATQESGVT